MHKNFLGYFYSNKKLFPESHRKPTSKTVLKKNTIENYTLPHLKKYMLQPLKKHVVMYEYEPTYIINRTLKTDPTAVVN